MGTLQPGDVRVQCCVDDTTGSTSTALQRVEHTFATMRIVNARPEIVSDVGPEIEAVNGTIVNITDVDVVSFPSGQAAYQWQYYGRYIVSNTTNDTSTSNTTTKRTKRLVSRGCGCRTDTLDCACIHHEDQRQSLDDNVTFGWIPLGGAVRPYLAFVADYASDGTRLRLIVQNSIGVANSSETVLRVVPPVTLDQGGGNGNDDDVFIPVIVGPAVVSGDEVTRS